MAQSIKIKRKDLITKLAGVKEDNVSLAGIAINRSKLLEALKLQTQPDADILTINYGKITWQADGSKGSNDLAPESCLQFSCDHTVLRFLNRPKTRYGQEPKIKHLNFGDYRQVVKPELTGIPINPQELIKALSFVLPCVATEMGRPVLNCILFESDNGIIKLVSADGYRLAIDQVRADGIPTNKVLIQLADIPRLLTFLKAIKPIGKGKSKSYPEIYLAHDYQTIKFSTNEGTLELEKQTGTFPDYSQLIPKDGTHIELIASDMLEAVKALNTITKDGGGIIRLKFSKYPDKLTLSAHRDDTESHVECLARVDKECYIAVNAKYLIDYLKTCKGNIIDLFIDKQSSPMLVYNGLDQFEVIMPMFVQW